MARITAEDCIRKIPNRFELILVASQRARELGEGAAPHIERDNDKNPVIALREIADDLLAIGELQENLIRDYQRVVLNDDLEDEEILDFMEGEQAMQGLMQAAGAADADDENTDADADSEADAATDDTAEDPAADDAENGAV